MDMNQQHLVQFIQPTTGARSEPSVISLFNLAKALTDAGHSEVPPEDDADYSPVMVLVIAPVNADQKQMQDVSKLPLMYAHNFITWVHGKELISKTNAQEAQS